MKKEQRRELLLSHARDVFAEKGYHAAKIDDIVAQASVARGTFYLHFDDKRGIFEELVDDFLSRISLAIVRIRVDDPSSAPLAQLRDNVYRVLDVGLGDPGMTKILLKNAAGLDADFDRKVRAFYRAIEELLALSLLNGQRMGLVRAGDRRVLGSLALGSIKETLLQSVEGRITASAPELADAVMRFLAGGILTPGLTGEPQPVRKERDEPHSSSGSLQS
ncbi:MAG: Transcriptional regulator, TetR family [Myxococcaceae bacterium]|nr:Transcriptional regulator, TetR family [Myxococcaceae bacterium]